MLDDFPKGSRNSTEGIFNWHNFVRMMRGTENPLHKWVYAVQAVSLVWRNAADSPRDILSGHTVLPMEINFSHCRENSVLAINKNLTNFISDRLFDNSCFTDDGVLSSEFNFKCLVDILGRTSVWILAVTVLCDPHKCCFVKTKTKFALIDTF